MLLKDISPGPKPFWCSAEEGRRALPWCWEVMIYLIIFCVSEPPERDCDPWRQKSAHGADPEALGWEGSPGVSCFFHLEQVKPPRSCGGSGSSHVRSSVPV